MITKEVLESFCEKGVRNCRKSLLKPFTIDNFTYATDGHICVRVPAIDGYVIDESLKDTILGLFQVVVDYVPYVPLQLEFKPCTKCDGTGRVDVCEDCYGDGEVGFTSNSGEQYEFECKLCDGEGVVKGDSSTCENCGGSGKVAKDKVVPFGSKFITVALYEKLSVLPNVQIDRCKDFDLRPIPFIFDSGMGIIMPCRKPD